jgi:ADP-ribose pyrophosphatase YjhB (NUDIX family)
MQYKGLWTYIADNCRQSSPEAFCAIRSAIKIRFLRNSVNFTMLFKISPVVLLVLYGSGPSAQNAMAIRFRNSAKAIIIEKGRLLVIRRIDSLGPFYSLPGGGQHPLESLDAALRRECMEEVCADVEVGPLALVRDYIAKNHEFAGCSPEFHQLEFMFVCKLKNPDGLKTGAEPDGSQTGFEWLDITSLSAVRLYPSQLKTRLSNTGILPGPVYLGDVN